MFACPFDVFRRRHRCVGEQAAARALQELEADLAAAALPRGGRQDAHVRQRGANPAVRWGVAVLAPLCGQGERLRDQPAEEEVIWRGGDGMWHQCQPPGLHHVFEAEVQI